MSDNIGRPAGAVVVAARHPLTPHAAAGLMAADRLEQSFNLRDLLRIFLKRKWTILIIFLVFQRQFVAALLQGSVKG